MGISHLAILNAHPGVELVGAADTSKLLRWGLGRYSSMAMADDYQALITQEKPDCVFIATPTKLHYPIARFCLEQGVHVFLEKPCCLNYEDSVALRDFAREKGLLIQAGYHNRYLGTFKHVRQLIESGELGELHYFHAEAYGPVVTRKKTETWRSNRNEGGGCLYDYASHVINLVQYLLDEVDSVSGTRLESIFSSGVEDAVYSSLQLRSGLTGHLTVDWSDESFRKMSTSITILGDRGRVEANAQEVKIYRNKDGRGDEEAGWKLSYLTDHTDAVSFYLRGEEYTAQVWDFIDNVSSGGGKHAVNSIDSAAETDRVIELLLQDSSGTAGRSETINLKKVLADKGMWERFKLLFLQQAG